MRVLVCGGRNFIGSSAAHSMANTLNVLHSEHTITALIEGGASGADTLARIWARNVGVKSVTVPANWAEFGACAGSVRNQRMVDSFKPDLVVAFPGGKGTADMVIRARIAGIKVMEVL